MKANFFRITASVISIFFTVLFLLPSVSIPDVDFKLVDKIVHACFFAVLFYIWFLNGVEKKRLFVFLVAYGIIIELLQASLPANFNRHYDFLDIVADTLGVAMAYVSISLARKF